MRRLGGLVLDVDDLVCEMAELLPGYLSDRVYGCRCKKISKDLAGNVRFKHFIRGRRLSPGSNQQAVLLHPSRLRAKPSNSQ